MLNVDGALGLQQIRHRVDGANNFWLVASNQIDGDIAQRHDTERVFTRAQAWCCSPPPATRCAWPTRTGCGR
jgi:hypothetical protein